MHPGAGANAEKQREVGQAQAREIGSRGCLRKLALFVSCDGFVDDALLEEIILAGLRIGPLFHGGDEGCVQLGMMGFDITRQFLIVNAVAHGAANFHDQHAHHQQTHDCNSPRGVTGGQNHAARGDDGQNAVPAEVPAPALVAALALDDRDEESFQVVHVACSVAVSGAGFRHSQPPSQVSNITSTIAATMSQRHIF